MRNFFSTILLFIIIPMTLVIVCASAIKVYIATPQFVKKELSTRDVYSVAQKQLILQSQLNMVDPTHIITSSDIERFITEVVSTSWMQQNTEQTIDRAFVWINTPVGTPLSLPLDLTDPKKHILPIFNTLLEEKIKDDLLKRNIPKFIPCNKDAPKDSPECLLLQLNVVQTKEAFIKKLPNQPEVLIAKIPDVIDLMNPVLPNFSFENATGTQQNVSAQSVEQAKQNLLNAEKIKSQYQQIIRYYFIALIAYLLLLLLYVLLNMKNVRRSVSSTGILFLTTGLPTCAGAVLGRKIVETKLIPQIPQSKEMSVELQKLLVIIVGDVEYSFFTIVLITGIILMLCGMVCILWSRFIQKPNE